MRFIILRKADAQTEAGAMPSQQLIVEMMGYNEELVNAGAMRAGEGLHPSSRGARVTFSGGKPSVSLGPFAGDLVAGFTIIEAASLDEAIAWARKWPPIDGGGEVELEIRQVLEADDFGTEFTPELREQEERLRARSAGKE